MAHEHHDHAHGSTGGSCCSGGNKDATAGAKGMDAAIGSAETAGMNMERQKWCAIRSAG